MVAVVDNGVRQSKTNDGVTTTYYYDGNKLVAELTGTEIVVYLYDANGSPIGMRYRNDTYAKDVWDVYWFDKNLQGDILGVYNSAGTRLVSYSYDPWGKVYISYSNGGASTSAAKNSLNITKKNGKDYSYGNATWKDLLTGFDGKTVEYDAQGNPTTYLGHTLTWEKGRQLKKFDNIEYTYNANGIRTSKKVNGVLHTYTLDGTKILREIWGSNTLIPLYDNEDGICGILYNNVPYYFIKNLQGDIIAIVDKDAQTVARYSYDAWGVSEIKLDSSDCQIATINPFRYRGYYYDEEIELYYLQSRYYSVSVGRFLNLDTPEMINNVNGVLDSNLFCYCCNSTTNFQDCFGYIAIAIGAGVTISLGTAVALIALTVFAFAYAFDRNFRNAVNQLFTMLIQGVIDGVGYLSNVISETVSKAKKDESTMEMKCIISLLKTITVLRVPKSLSKVMASKLQVRTTW